MLRPIAPFVEYAINYDYISKVLCINKDKPELACNGKCHVMQELEKQQQQDFNSLQISMEEYPIGFVELLSIPKIQLFNVKKERPTFYHQNYHYLAGSSVFHPPNNLHFILFS